LIFRGRVFFCSAKETRGTNDFDWFRSHFGDVKGGKRGDKGDKRPQKEREIYVSMW
jgi:hypothetical protein